MIIVWAGVIKQSKAKQPWKGFAIDVEGGLVKCPRNTAPDILATILKLVPSSSLNITANSATFNYVVIALMAALKMVPNRTSSKLVNCCIEKH